MPHFLRLLGSPRLESGGKQVKGRAAQRRRIGLLALLASTPSRQLSRDKLMAYLWPEATNEQARKLLSEAIYVLRKELGEGVLRSIGYELLLDTAALPTDVVLFREALRTGDLGAAVALYAGPFLDGWFVDDAPELERLIELERDQLARAYADARRALAVAAEDHGQWAEAAEHWRALVALDPLTSASAFGLARALARAGEPAAALQAIAAHEAALRSELDLTPAAELIDLARSIRSGCANQTLRSAEQSTSSAARVAEPESASRQTDSPLTATSAPIAGRRRPRARALGGALAGVLLLSSVGGWLAIQRARSRTGAGEGNSMNRMAVLYFDDHSIEQDLAPIASGITEELIHQLSGVSSFQVVSRNGVKPFRNRPVSVDSIARALRVGTLVEGSIQQSGDLLRVSVEFIDARTGTDLESRVFERPKEELFALEQDIGMAIAADLRRRLGRELHPRRVRAGTKSYRAASLALQGDALFDLGDSTLTYCDSASRATGIADLQRADSLYSAAAEADPEWSLPWVGRGRVARRRANLEEEPHRNALYGLAVDDANEAIRRDSVDGEAYELRAEAKWGLVQINPELQGNTPAMRSVGSDLNVALSRDSTLAGAWATLSSYDRSRGEYPAAERAAMRAFATDAYLKDAQRVALQLIASEYETGRVDSGNAFCARGRSLMPENWRFLECELTGVLYAENARPQPDRAWRLVHRLEALDDRQHFTSCGFDYAPTYWSMVAATVDARAGRASAARRTLAEARREVAGRPDLLESFEPDEAYLLHVLGAEDSAVVIKQRASQQSAILADYFDHDPRLRAIGASVRGRTGTP